MQCSLDFVKSLPFVRGLLKKEMLAMERRLRGSLPARPPTLPQRRALPLEGGRAEEVLAALVEAARRDGDGSGKLSGALYLPREGGGESGEDDDEFVVVFEEGDHYVLGFRRDWKFSPLKGSFYDGSGFCFVRLFKVLALLEELVCENRRCLLYLSYGFESLEPVKGK